MEIQINNTPTLSNQTEADSERPTKRRVVSQLFHPYRAIGYVTNGNIIVNKMQTESFLISSLGKGFQMYNVSPILPHTLEYIYCASVSLILSNISFIDINLQSPFLFILSVLSASLGECG